MARESTESRINKWLTLGANLGVLVGLFLLVFELRQNADLAIAQFRLDRSIAYDQFEQISIDPSFAEVWSKSVLDPQALTPAEYRILDSYLALRTTIWARTYRIEQAGYAPKGDTENDMRRYAGIWFGNSFAKAWWVNEKPKCGTGEFCALIDSVLLEVSPDENQRWVESIQNALASERKKALGE